MHARRLLVLNPGRSSVFLYRFPLGMEGCLAPLISLPDPLHEEISKTTKQKESQVNCNVNMTLEVFLRFRNCDSQVGKGFSESTWDGKGELSHP